jgi:hypothetical protein
MNLIVSTPAESTNCRKRERESPDASLILMDTPEFNRPLVKRRNFGRKLEFDLVEEQQEEAAENPMEELFLNKAEITSFSKKQNDSFYQACSFFARDITNDLIERLIVPNSKGKFIFRAQIKRRKAQNYKLYQSLKSWSECEQNSSDGLQKVLTE